MFLEPVYLNKTMLLNCASYLFGGVVLNEEKTISKNAGNTTSGRLSGAGKFGLNVFAEIVSAQGDMKAEHSRQKEINTEIKTTSEIALGAIHQSVLEELCDKQFIKKVSSSSINQYLNENKYVEIKATLIPVDYFAILQIFKMIVPQLENLFNLFGSSLLSEADNDIRNEQKQNIINSFSLLTDLVNKLEATYLESNQLEMLMIDEDSKKEIGVVDIDIEHLNPNEIKAKLTDGNFVVIGKVTKFVKEGDSINLLGRTLIATITEKLEIIIEWCDQQGIGSEETTLNSKWNVFKDLVIPLLDKLVMNKVEGSALRIKAMSICM